MKLGIITFQNVPNYGAALQAYALCKFLKTEGYDCEIINYQCKGLIKRERKAPSVRNLRSLLYYAIYKHRKISGHDHFMRSSGMLSEKEYNRDNIKEANRIYDTFITGSDQVWNPSLTEEDYSYFLDFSEDTKGRIAFAASAGEEWSADVKERVSRMISRYNYVNVREDKLKDVLASCGITCANVVCDPTMLLPVEEYKKLSRKPKEDNYVLVYYPTSELLNAAQEYAQKRGLAVLVIAMGRKEPGFIKISPNSPEEWLGYIENADTVFTSSYHGLLFSLYFNKKVWGIYKQKRGSRWETIIERLSISECLLNENSRDYRYLTTQYQQRIEEYRKESIMHLREALKKVNCL